MKFVRHLNKTNNKILNITMTDVADRPFPLSRLHSSGQTLKTQAWLQLTSVTEEKVVDYFSLL